MAGTLIAMLRELRSDKEAIDRTILTLERLVRERDQESTRPVGDAADPSDTLSKAPRKKGTSRAEGNEESR